MRTLPFLSLIAARRACRPVAWLFVFLVLAVFLERRVADSDFDDGYERLYQNDEAVEGEEILQKLLLANDVVTPIAPKATPLDGERPILLTATALSLLVVRGIASRAPPTAPASA